MSKEVRSSQVFLSQVECGCPDGGKGGLLQDSSAAPTEYSLRICLSIHSSHIPKQREMSQHDIRGKTGGYSVMKQTSFLTNSHWPKISLKATDRTSVLLSVTNRRTSSKMASQNSQTSLWSCTQHHTLATTHVKIYYRKYKVTTLFWRTGKLTNEINK